MLSKNKIKYINSLHTKKNRKEHRRFVVEGDKIVKECLNNIKAIDTIYASKSWFDNNISKKEFNEKLHFIVSERELKQISQLKSPNNALALLKIEAFEKKIDTEKKQFLYLDGIRDPGNLGTIIRTAEWFGFNQVICSEDCVDLFNHKSLMSTMGSFLRVALVKIGLSEFLETIPEISLYVADMNGESMYGHKFQEPFAIIIGNESLGPSNTALELAKGKIRIPKTADTAIDSLNAAISAALLMSEIRRGL